MARPGADCRGPARLAWPGQQPADGHRVPHAQGLALRGGGQGLARRGPQALRAGYYEALAELTSDGAELPSCGTGDLRCAGSDGPAYVRSASGPRWASCARASSRRATRRRRWLSACGPRGPAGHPRPHPRAHAPRVQAVYETATAAQRSIPDELRLTPGSSTTLRGALGDALSYLNKASNGRCSGLGGPLRLHERQRGRPSPARLLQRRSEPGGAAHLHRGHLRGRHRRGLSGLSAFGHRSAPAAPTAPSSHRWATSPRAARIGARPAWPSPASRTTP